MSDGTGWFKAKRCRTSHMAIVSVGLQIEPGKEGSHAVVVVLAEIFKRMLVAFRAPEPQPHERLAYSFSQFLSRLRDPVEGSRAIGVRLAPGQQNLSNHLVDRSIGLNA